MLFEESSNGKSDFNSLLEHIASRENIIHAVRKVKSNTGFQTSGTDNITGNDILQMDGDDFFTYIQKCIMNYQPNMVRRVYIPKKNGKKRPLGIPSIVDRIIQTAICNIIEPILEGKFYEHSYGFRPMRSVEHVLAYTSTIVNHSNKYWVVEGDIKSFFDMVNHDILINKLYKYGIRDKRVLMLIKKILKAGIENEKEVNNIGTPQGGTLSPLLANLYLTDFDHWVDRQWRKFETNRSYYNQGHKIRALKDTNLKSGYLIRYADDWIILTDSEENAIKWKHSCSKFLREKLKIELSDEKTKVSDLRTTQVDFLGFSMKCVKGSKGKYTLRTQPNIESLESKMGDVYSALRDIRKSSNNGELVENISNYNSIVRGINNYYRYCTKYNTVLSEYDWKMKDSFNRTIRVTTGKRVLYRNCVNVHNKQSGIKKTTTIGFEIEGRLLGLEKLGLGNYKVPRNKAQWINPYSAKGRLKWEEITGQRWGTINRNPWLTLGNVSSLIAKNSKENKIYNLEYFLNRAMAYNRDKGKCKVCKSILTGNGDVEVHHKNKDLPIDKINKVNNLVTLCKNCHLTEHNKKPKKKVTKQTQKPKSDRKPSKEILLEEIRTTPFTELGKKYGVSDNAVRKWAKSYGIYEERLIKLKPSRG